MEAFFERKPDVVVLACSIVSFEETLQRRPSLQKYPETLFVDVLSVKEHAREALLKHLPAETGVLCTHRCLDPIPRSLDGRTWRSSMTKYEYLRILQMPVNGFYHYSKVRAVGWSRCRVRSMMAVRREFPVFNSFGGTDVGECG